MHDQERVPLDLTVEDQDIDIEQIARSEHRPSPTPEQQKHMHAAGKRVGFVHRQPNQSRRRTPYTSRFGGRCRPGMKVLFQEVAARLDLPDTKTFELAILALIESEGLDDLKQKHRSLTRNRRVSSSA